MLTSGELILTERMLASTISSRVQMFSAQCRHQLALRDPIEPLRHSPIKNTLIP